MADVPPVDLTTCDREPIHIPGRIQTFGCLVTVSSDLIVNRRSDNTASILGIEDNDIIGLPLSELFTSPAIHAIRGRMQHFVIGKLADNLHRIKLTDAESLFDVTLHLSGESLVLEIEPAEDASIVDYSLLVRSLVDRLSQAESSDDFYNTLARQTKALMGFGRVMVYRFEPDGSGLVIAEDKKYDQDSYLGLRYPASDIPRQARALYERNALRIIADVEDEPAAIHPAVDPTGEPLDLSLSILRAVSPIHIEYLKNMGVSAATSLSVMRRGRLWGLIACHHDEPRVPSFMLRGACGLFAQSVSHLIDQRENDQEKEYDRQARRFHDGFIARVAEGEGVEAHFVELAETLPEIIPFDGIVAWLDGRFQSRGMTPSEQEFNDLARFLNTTAVTSCYATEKLADVLPSAAAYKDRAAGLLALPVSRNPRDYIVLFRREIARSLVWAGDPNKPVEATGDGLRLTPRKSFDAWHETVHGSCEPWSVPEQRTAESLRVTLLEIVLRLTDVAVAEQARAQERQSLLIAELNHRVRNILNLIRGLVTQSGEDASSVPDFVEKIGGRIEALARAHDQITNEQWSAASVRDLIATAMKPYLGTQESRVKITGDDMLLEPAAFATLSLVVHELMTNSVKYGGLSDSGGTVSVTMGLNANGDLTLRWEESGGPPVEAPRRRGFGSTVIERSIPYDLNGTAELRFEVTGVSADFSIPAQYVVRSAPGSQHSGDESAQPLPRNVLTGPVLLVEDNIIIALDTEKYLLALGATYVHTASGVSQALETLQRHQVEFALLDVNLGVETSTPVAERLEQLGIPFALATGYGDDGAISETFGNAPIAKKPFDEEALGKVISAAQNKITAD